MLTVDMTEMGPFMCASWVFVFIIQFIQNEGSLVLTSVPAAATTDSHVITLVCSSSWGRVNRYWYRDENVIFRTTESLSTLSKAAISNPYVYSKYLSGRVSVKCGVVQHNVTLRINASIDRGTEWWCKDTVKSETSNHIILLSAKSGRHADLSKVTTNDAVGAEDNDSGSGTVVYIAAGSTCAAVVIVVVVAVIFVRRRRSHTSNATQDDILHTVSTESAQPDGHKQYEEAVTQGGYVHVLKDKVR